MHKGLLFSLILSVLLVVFALQNTAPVALNLWFWTVHTSLALLVIVLLALGALLGYLLMLPSVYRKDRMLKGKSQEIDELRKSRKTGPELDDQH